MATLLEDAASLLDKQRIEGILKALHEQRKLCRFCDVVLRVCGEEIFAHSNVLAAASPYFGSFLGQGQDLPRAFSQKTPQVIEIHIDGSDGDSGYGEAVIKVVDYMYTSSVSLNMGIATQVLEISKIMQMESLARFCENFQNGFRGDKIVPSADAVFNSAVTHVHIGTSIDESLEISSASSTLKVPANRNTAQIKIDDVSKPKKRGRGRPRKIPKEEESDDDFSEFITLMAEEEQKEKEIEMKKKETSETKDDIVKDVPVKEENGDDTSEVVSVMRRTRGRPPITSILTATRCSARLRGSIRGSRYKSDYVLHPLRRMGRNAMNMKFKRGLDEESEDNYKRDFILKGRRYDCDKCDFKTKRVRVLSEHKKIHLHAAFICSFCEHKEGNEEDFKTHMEKHDGPTPYFCKFCDHKFKSRTQLTVHLPKHREDKPFVCNLCTAGFKWKHALKNHMITHSITKDHLCDICGFATAHKSQLKAHRLIHTGETFKCDFGWCNFEATKRQNLKYHMLTHTHEKPHQCEICGHSFSLIKNMKRHMLLHTGSRPHSCEECTFTTTRYDKLKEHMLKQHSIGYPPTKKHRLSDYHDEENVLVPAEDMVSEATLQTVANIAMAVDEAPGETQIFSTIDGVPIVARVQFAEINSEGVIQYVAQVE